MSTIDSDLKLSRCLIALGANMGNCERNVQRAIQAIDSFASIRVVQSSTIHRTAPVGGPKGQPQFVNAAALAESSLSAVELIAVLLEIERDFGRQRDVRWQARSLDLDLLLHEHHVIELPESVVPHPRMTFRRFVLEPAAEIAASMQHPIVKMTVSELLASINSPQNLIAIESAAEGAAEQIAMRVAAACNAIVSPADMIGSVNVVERLKAGETILVPGYAASHQPENSNLPLPKLSVAVLSGDRNPDVCQSFAKRELLKDVRTAMLVVNVDQPELAEDEIIAAIDAMR